MAPSKSSHVSRVTRPLGPAPRLTIPVIRFVVSGTYCTSTPAWLERMPRASAIQASLHAEREDDWRRYVQVVLDGIRA